MYGEDQLTVTLSRWSHSMITPLSDVRRALTMTGHRCPWNHFSAAEAGIISPEFSALIYSLLVYVASGVSALVHKSMQRKRLSKRHAANIHDSHAGVSTFVASAKIQPERSADWKVSHSWQPVQLLNQPFQPTVDGQLRSRVKYVFVNSPFASSRVWAAKVTTRAYNPHSFFSVQFANFRQENATM